MRLCNRAVALSCARSLPSRATSASSLALMKARCMSVISGAPGNHQVCFQEPVARAGGLQLVGGEDLEWQVEALVEFVLPLLGEAPRTDHKAPLQIAAGDQLLDEEPSHDGLAGARIVGQEEAQRLARQHCVVDRRDLMRQRLDHRGVDRQDGIEQVCKPDAVRFGDEAEKRAVAIETPGATLFDHIEAGLIVAVEQLVRHLAG